MRANPEALTQYESSATPIGTCYEFFDYMAGAQLVYCKPGGNCTTLRNACIPYDKNYRTTKLCYQLVY